tara:strand:- start:151790 stop:152083 length:294 start_codon:yes stop_codon:yes gene_type:complete
VSGEDYLLPCLNKSLFGINCPGCGFQRSILELAAGNFQQAFELYPAIYTLIILGLFLLFRKKLKLKNNKKITYTLIGINAMIITVNYCFKMSYLLHI